jgi:WD40 repeat protein
MQYIEGASLAAIIAALRQLRDNEAPAVGDQGTPLALTLASNLIADSFKAGSRGINPNSGGDFRNSLFVFAVVRLATQAALAVEHAHDQGILHRDIKPGNLLLDCSGKLWITDFGLARILGSGSLTTTGDLPGTLRYMSPEQALGKRSLVDRRSDIYALGATLYELLSLEPAIDGDERWEILTSIGRENPPPVNRFNPAVPVDLATIVAKSMAKDVGARYQSAGELADDLNRFLFGRPVKARPASPWTQAALWCKRNVLASSLMAALFIVLLSGLGVGVALLRRADVESLRANQSALSERKLRIESQSERALRDLDQGLELARRGLIDHGLPFMVEAIHQAPEERPEVGQIARVNLSAWQSHITDLDQILEHRAPLRRAIFRADGAALVTGCRDGLAQVWATATGKPVGPSLQHESEVSCVAYSPDGRRILTGTADGNLRLWDAATGRIVVPVCSHGDYVLTVEFAPDGSRFMSHGRNRTARLWSAATGAAIGGALEPGDVVQAQFSPDGRQLLTCGINGLVRFWDAQTGQPTGLTLRHGSSALVAAYSPDGTLIATGGEDGSLRTWESASLRALTGPVQAHSNAITRIVFSPSGHLVVTASNDGTARLWKSASGEPPITTLRHDGEIYEARFSPDGKLIVTAGGDHMGRIWDVATGRPIGLPLRHRLAVTDAAFSADGKLVTTASDDGTAKLWRVDKLLAELTAQRPGGRTEDKDAEPATSQFGIRFSTGVFSADRKRVLFGSRSAGLARLVDTASGQPVSTPLVHRWSHIRAVAFSPDNCHIATVSHPNGFQEGGGTSTTCQIWDAATGRPTSPMLPHVNFVSALAFHPRGHALATGDYSGAVHLWDVKTGASIGPPFHAGYPILTVAFSPDGRVLAVGTAEWGYRAMLWDLATGLPRGEPLAFKGNVGQLAFSPDSRLLAIGSTDATARLVDVATGDVIGGPFEHPGSIRSLAFSPDGTILLTGHAESTGVSTARIWSLSADRATRGVMTHPNAGMINAVAFSPNGELFASGCNNGSVYLWHVASARQIGPPYTMRDAVITVAFGADGETLMAADARGLVRKWPVPRTPVEPVEELTRRTEVRTGLELGNRLEISVLQTKPWLERRALVTASEPGNSSPDETARYESAARDAEVLDDAFGARWNLDRLLTAVPGDGLLRARRAVTFLESGKFSECQADLRAALELGPRDAIFDWLTQRSYEDLLSKRPGLASRIIEPVAVARPGDWRLHALLAKIHGALGHRAQREIDVMRAVEHGADVSFLMEVAAEHARAGRWDSAAQLFGTAINQGVVPHEVWQQAAIAFVKAGNVSGYRQLCTSMRRRFPADIPERWVAASLADVSMVGAGGIGNDGKAIGWGESALATLAPSTNELYQWVVGTLGGNLFRAGRFREAVDRINAGLASGAVEIRPENAMFLAMAHEKLGNHELAQQIYSRYQVEDRCSTPDDFWDVTARNRLREEARRLILDRNFPDDPFGREASSSISAHGQVFQGERVGLNNHNHPSSSPDHRRESRLDGSVLKPTGD